MSETKFTPGPWRVETRAATRVVAGTDDTIASTACQSSLVNEWGDNAYLIAAAPDLYAALAGIKWRSADKDNMEFAATISYSQMDAIRAALAKAEGRS